MKTAQSNFELSRNVEKSIKKWKKLSTSKRAKKSKKVSYTPSYTHYPH